MADALTRAEAALLRRAAKIISRNAYWQKQGCRTEWQSADLGPLLREEHKSAMQTAKALRELAKGDVTPNRILCAVRVREGS